MSIINPVAVAHIEAAQTTVPPDRVLNEPVEDLGKRRIELPGIDLLRNDLNDISAAARLVASQPIGVLGVEPMQDAGPVQKVVNERVDGDHAAADLNPHARPIMRTHKDPL